MSVAPIDKKDMSAAAKAADGDCCDGKVVRGRPRDLSKNKAIIDAASELFMEKGFDGTSMDEVARRAGVSKQTVYSHFAGKEVLFGEAIRETIHEYFPDGLLEYEGTHSLEDELRVVADKVIRLLVSEDAIAMFRLLSASASQKNGGKLAAIFWEAGPAIMIERLDCYLRAWVETGDLVIPDMERACKTFLSLLKGHLHFVLAIGLIDHVSEEDIQAHAEAAVAQFIKLYSNG